MTDLIDATQWTFTEELCEYICQKVTEGWSLTDLANKNGIPPYYVMAKWRRDYPHFQEKINLAYKDRGEVYHGRAIQKAEAAEEDTIQVTKLQVETMKWASAVDDPNRFGNKTKISGDSASPLTILIDTGIHRPELPAASVPAITSNEEPPDETA